MNKRGTSDEEQSFLDVLEKLGDKLRIQSSKMWFGCDAVEL